MAGSLLGYALVCVVACGERLLCCIDCYCILVHNRAIRTKFPDYAISYENANRSRNGTWQVFRCGPGR